MEGSKGATDEGFKDVISDTFCMFSYLKVFLAFFILCCAKTNTFGLQIVQHAGIIHDKWKIVSISYS